MERSDRLLLETQVRGLEQMMREMNNMRSVLLRRMRRLEDAPRPRARPISRQNFEPRALVDDFVQEPIQEPVQAPTQISDILEENQNHHIRRQKKIPALKTRTIALKKSEWSSVMTDVCGICLELHNISDSCVCDCNHRFGHKCFSIWNRSCHDSKRKTTCPTCRETVKVITNFRQRMSTKKKTPTEPAPAPNPQEVIVLE